jgi:hypothetical protein
VTLFDSSKPTYDPAAADAYQLQQWERSATEPLHVYSQFSQIIRQRLAFRHQKHVQHELVQDALEASRDKLETLEKAEREARRLEEALERGGRVVISEEEREREREQERERQRRSASRGQTFGLLGAVKHSLSGMMDHDPEATRRANIGKLRENIAQVRSGLRGLDYPLTLNQLEDSLQASTQDLKYASSTLQADLDRFQRQKVADLRKLAINLASIHREWCRTNLEAWQKAKDAVNQIETHPNELAIENAADPKPEVPAKEFGFPSPGKGKGRAVNIPEDTKPFTPAGRYGVEASPEVVRHAQGNTHHDELLRADLETEQAAAIPLPLAESEFEGADKSHDGPLGPL